MNSFFEKLVNTLNLGKIIKKEKQITGGLTHKMFKIETSKGKYIIKLLNPNIMKRPTAINNFNRSDILEEKLKENKIEAIYSIKFNDIKMQEIDGQYFYIFNWYDGKSLTDDNIKPINCKKISEALAKIHNIDIKYEFIERKEINVNWKYYINLAKEKKSPIYDVLKDLEVILNDSMIKGNEAIKKLPKIKCICHNDLDSKNVLWVKDEYKIIDLECLDYSNPYLELFELALCWSGYESCNINEELFNIFIRTYLDNSKLDMNINFEDIYYSNYGRLGWLEFNIKRALMIDCDTLEEQQIGINEVKETIKHIIYYDSAKDIILNNINRIIGG